MLAKFRTQGYNGYGVQWSPFFENKLAVASSANYGLVGNGRLFILNTAVGPAGINVERVYDTQDGLFDITWSEVNENQLVTASGDGSIKLWDATLGDFPIQNWQEHTREVFSVHWNLVNKDTFVSGSWDHSIKLWNPQAPHSLQTYKEHTHCVYSTQWSPHSGTLFASASGDQLVKIWDTKSPRSVQTVRAHNNEILSLDWNKYTEHTIVTGSVDHTVKVWDLRHLDRELVCLRGHEYAVRKVKCSPHQGNIVASAGYDMSVRVWDVAAPGEMKMVELHDLHTEFVLGVDFNLYIEGQIATCAWDEMVHVFVPPALVPRR
ncbi:WD40-repeat-containing domain protein [Endogone sp. FLAS-F59071]|nr:WD40-repeat-containing domain protein [Endogone sp. FLAS-F59071]|eukprot:RUS22255.1 WD40-repeat-containing domain protein [Endogone sp. FLAS-F59071]